MPVVLLAICLGHAVCAFAAEPIYVVLSGRVELLEHIKSEEVRRVRRRAVDT